MNIEQIEITIQSSGKKQKRQVSWLLSERAGWSYDAAPVLITDAKIGDKLHGDFSGTPVKVRILSKYPYLKSRIEDYEEQREEDKAAPVRNVEPTEAAQTEETNQGGVEELVREEIMLLSVEELKSYLKGQGVEYNTRKKAVEYFQELAINTIK